MHYCHTSHACCCVNAAGQLSAVFIVSHPKPSTEAQWPKAAQTRRKRQEEYPSCTTKHRDQYSSNPQHSHDFTNLRCAFENIPSLPSRTRQYRTQHVTPNSRHGSRQRQAACTKVSYTTSDLSQRPKPFGCPQKPLPIIWVPGPWVPRPNSAVPFTLYT